MNPISSTGPAFTVETVKQYLKLHGVTAKSGAKLHSYSKTLALTYGSIAAALLLKHLAFCVRKSRPGADGVQRTIRSSAEISAHYCYLTVSTIAATLGRLPVTVLRRKRTKNRKTGALSTAYSFVDVGAMTAADSDLVYFDPTDAEKYGLHEAILLHWLGFRIRKGQEKNPLFRYHPVSATDLAPKLGISRASLSRAIKNLVTLKVWERNPQRNGKLSEYGINRHPPGLALTAPLLNPGNGALTPG